MPEANKIVLKLNNLMRYDPISYDSIWSSGEFFGIISIMPNFDSVFVELSNADIRDTLFRNLFIGFPLISQTKLLNLNYIGYNELTVCNFGPSQSKWFKLKPNKYNLFYVYSTFSKRPNESTLYLELPLRINNFQTEETFRFSKGSNLASIDISE